MPGEHTRTSQPRSDTHPTSNEARPSIGVYFRCANAYQRVFRNAQGTAYLARCPKCAKTMTFRVGPSGSAQRQFEISC